MRSLPEVIPVTDGVYARPMSPADAAGLYSDHIEVKDPALIPWQRELFEDHFNRKSQNPNNFLYGVFREGKVLGEVDLIEAFDPYGDRTELVSLFEEQETAEESLAIEAILKQCGPEFGTIQAIIHHKRSAVIKILKELGFEYAEHRFEGTDFKLVRTAD